MLEQLGDILLFRCVKHPMHVNQFTTYFNSSNKYTLVINSNLNSSSNRIFIKGYYLNTV